MPDAPCLAPSAGAGSRSEGRARTSTGGGGRRRPPRLRTRVAPRPEPPCGGTGPASHLRLQPCREHRTASGRDAVASRQPLNRTGSGSGAQRRPGTVISNPRQAGLGSKTTQEVSGPAVEEMPPLSPRRPCTPAAAAIVSTTGPRCWR